MKMTFESARVVGDINEILHDQLKADPMFRTYKIVVDEPYASFVENGVGPAYKKDAETDEYGNNTRMKIERWVDRKFGNQLTPRQKRDMAYAVYKKIMQEGLQPSPYMQPAVDDTLADTTTLQQLFETGGLKAIVDYIAEKMRENLYILDHIATHDLVNSIEVRDGSIVEIREEGVWAHEE